MPVKICESTTVISPQGAPSKGGRLRLQLMSAGIGSSGSYPPETLVKAASERVFPAGTHQYLNHAAESRRGPLGERLVQDLVSVLVEDAYYDESSQALVADAQVFPAWQPVMSDPLFLESIGLSITGEGEVQETSEGSVITRITSAESVDWVSRAGRGGKVLKILESAGKASTKVEETLQSTVQEKLREIVQADSESLWVRDYDEAQKFVIMDSPDGLYRQSFIVDDAGRYMLSGERTKVIRSVEYISADPEPEEPMADTQPTLDPELSARLSAVETERDELRAQLEERDNAQRIAEAHKLINEKVGQAVIDLPDPMADRVRSSVLAEAGDSLPDNLSVIIESAIKAECEYLAALDPGHVVVVGLGESTPPAQASSQKRTRTAFGREIKEG